jgi:RNA polymerase sigma-70 factor (ECF subfamily)
MPERPDLSQAADFENAFHTYREAMIVTAQQVLRERTAAEDLVQDVFLQLWLAPDRYDPSRGRLGSYLTMLVRHRALDRWRSRAVATSAVDRLADDFAAHAAPDDSAADRVVRRETAQAVRAAVHALPPAQREAILLTYGAGLSVPEVASATATPLGTAKSRVRLGLRAAGRRLAADGL